METGNHRANGQEECGMSKINRGVGTLLRRFKENSEQVCIQGARSRSLLPRPRVGSGSGGEESKEQNKMERWEGGENGKGSYFLIHPQILFSKIFRRNQMKNKQRQILH